MEKLRKYIILFRFQNPKCYARHLQTACKYFHRCAICKHTYNVKTKNEHICGRKYCQLCYRYHDDDKGNILYE